MTITISAAPILSGTYTSALEKGGDLYLDYSARYNSSSLNAIGLATATDSLAAIKKAVFEDKTVTLGEFIEIEPQELSAPERKGFVAVEWGGAKIC